MWDLEAGFVDLLVTEREHVHVDDPGTPAFGPDPAHLLFDGEAKRLPEHVEAVLNDRVIDLQGGLQAELHPGDVLTFIPAHAGG